MLFTEVAREVFLRVFRNSLSIEPKIVLMKRNVLYRHS